jgi:hypothetical protein
MARRYRKSPVGLVRWNTMVLALGVWIPEMGVGGPECWCMPTIVPS